MEILLYGLMIYFIIAYTLLCMVIGFQVGTVDVKFKKIPNISIVAVCLLWPWALYEIYKKKAV